MKRRRRIGRTKGKCPLAMPTILKHLSLAVMYTSTPHTHTHTHTHIQRKGFQISRRRRWRWRRKRGKKER